MSSRAAAICLLSAVTACTGSKPVTTTGKDAATGKDAVTPPDPRAAICPDGGTPAFVAFTQIQQIFDDNCISCHGNAGQVPNLSDGKAWNSLVGQPATPDESCGGLLVSPGNAANSYIYQKLSSPTPCAGAQMPRGELFSDPLPSCVVAMVAQWINEGAPGGSTDGGSAD